MDQCERALAEPKVKIDQRDSEGQTALMIAAANGHVDVVQWLVMNGARLHAKCDVGILRGLIIEWGSLGFFLGLHGFWMSFLTGIVG